MYIPKRKHQEEFGNRQVIEKFYIVDKIYVN